MTDANGDDGVSGASTSTSASTSTASSAPAASTASAASSEGSEDGAFDGLSALLSSATLVMLGTILYSGSTLLERVVLSRFLGTGAYGRVAISLGVMEISTTLALIGLTQGIPRFMSRFDDERDLRGIWASGLLISLVLASLVTAVYLLNVEWFVARLFDDPDPQSRRLFSLFVLAIPMYVVLYVGVAAIRGFEVTIYKSATQDVLYPVGRLAVLGALLYLGFGTEAAGYAYLVALGVSGVVAHVLLARLMTLVGPIRTHAREMVAFSLPLILATLITVMLFRTDTFLVAFFRTDQAAGLYEFAYSLAGAMSLVLSAFGFLYLPMTSRLDADGRLDEVNTLYQVTTKWVYVVTFPAFLAFTVFAADVLAIFFTDAAAAAAPALTIVSIGFFVSAAAGRSRETLSALGNTKAVFYSNAVAFALNLVLNVALIPRYGIVGAAITSALSYVLLYAIVYVILRRNYGITPFSSYSTRTFLILPLVLFPPTILLSEWVSLTVLTLPVFLVGAGLVTVILVSITGCLQPADAVPLDLIEDRLGITIPLIRRFVPDAEPDLNLV